MIVTAAFVPAQDGELFVGLAYEPRLAVHEVEQNADSDERGDRPGRMFLRGLEKTEDSFHPDAPPTLTLRYRRRGPVCKRYCVAVTQQA